MVGGGHVGKAHRRPRPPPGLPRLYRGRPRRLSNPDASPTLRTPSSPLTPTGPSIWTSMSTALSWSPPVATGRRRGPGIRLSTRARYIGLLGSRRKTPDDLPAPPARRRAPRPPGPGSTPPRPGHRRPGTPRTGRQHYVRNHNDPPRRPGQPMTMDDWYLERAERRAHRATTLPTD